MSPQNPGSRKSHRGQFVKSLVLKDGRVLRDARINRKGRRKGVKNKLKRVARCPHCYRKFKLRLWHVVTV